MPEDRIRRLLRHSAPSRASCVISRGHGRSGTLGCPLPARVSHVSDLNVLNSLLATFINTLLLSSLNSRKLPVGSIAGECEILRQEPERSFDLIGPLAEQLLQKLLGPQ